MRTAKGETCARRANTNQQHPNKTESSTTSCPSNLRHHSLVSNRSSITYRLLRMLSVAFRTKTQRRAAAVFVVLLLVATACTVMLLTLQQVDEKKYTYATKLLELADVHRSFFPRVWTLTPFEEEEEGAVSWTSLVSYEHDLPANTATNNETGVWYDYRRCRPAASWHALTHPTCNAVHELDFASGLYRHAGVAPTHPATIGDLLYVRQLERGHTRDTWKMRRASAPPPEGHSNPRDRPFVLKTSRWINGDFTEWDLEHSRIDALATERLTASPHVIDMFAYCGASVINEFGDGGHVKDFLWRKEGATEAAVTSRQRLVFARDAALGLADVHAVGLGGADTKRSNSNLTTLVHHDLKVNNMLVVRGSLKIHDFNNAHLLKWNHETDKRCGFHFSTTCSDLAEIIQPPGECLRLKEERYVTEKIEVFKLGMIFYFLLLGQEDPRYATVDALNNQKTTNSSSFTLRSGIADNGTVFPLSNPPPLPRYIVESDDKTTRALVRAMVDALTVEVAERPSAREIGTALSRMVAELSSDKR